MSDERNPFAIRKRVEKDLELEEMSEGRSAFTIAHLKKKEEEQHAMKMDNELCMHMFVFMMTIFTVILVSLS